MADVKVSWLQLETAATPCDVKVSWICHDTDSTPCDVKVSWVCLDTSAPAIQSTVETFSGGWLGPNTRRKTRRDVYLERVKLGIIKEEIATVAEEIVQKATKPIDFVEIVGNNRPDVADMVTSLMNELRVTVKSPDYTRAIQAALEVQRMKEARRLQDEEDEEVLLLLM